MAHPNKTGNLNLSLFIWIHKWEPSVMISYMFPANSVYKHKLKQEFML